MYIINSHCNYVINKIIKLGTHRHLDCWQRFWVGSMNFFNWLWRSDFSSMSAGLSLPQTRPWSITEPSVALRGAYWCT